MRLVCCSKSKVDGVIYKGFAIGKCSSLMMKYHCKSVYNHNDV